MNRFRIAALRDVVVRALVMIDCAHEGLPSEPPAARRPAVREASREVVFPMREGEQREDIVQLLDVVGEGRPRFARSVYHPETVGTVARDGDRVLIERLA